MKPLVLILLLVVCNGLYGQQKFVPGYIITNNNEKIEGWIDKRESDFNQKHCYFKTDSLAQNDVEYKPNQIKAYRFNNSKYYASKVIKTKTVVDTVFLECLISGKATIWFYSVLNNDTYFVEKDSIMIELDNETQHYIYGDIDRIEKIDARDATAAQYTRNSQKYIGILKYTFSDCPEIYPQLDRLRYEKKDLIQISKKYHEKVCKTEDCIIYEKVIPKTKWYLGAFVNYGIQSTHVNSYGENGKNMNFSTYYPLSFGAFVQLNNPDISEHLYFQFAASYVNTNVDNVVKTQQSVDYYYNLKMSAIRIEPAFMYRLNYNKTHPYIMIGLPIDFLLDEKLSYTRKLVDIFYSDYFEVETKQNLMLGSHLSLGVERDITSSFSVFTSVNYNYLFSTKNEVVEYKFKTVNLNLGIKF
jgi:hypothetical protein